MDAILVSPHQVAQLEEHLLLIRRILHEAAPPARRRGWLLEQCRRRGDDVRDLWQALARYRQTGAAGLLAGTWRRPTSVGRTHCCGNWLTGSRSCAVGPGGVPRT